MKLKTDFGVGFFVTVKFAENWDIQPEINYSRQGSEFSINNVYSNGDTYNFTNAINLYYVNIPILFKYKATNNFSLEFGPQIGLLTEANLLVKANGRTNAQDFKKYFKDYDFSLLLGANYEFNKILFVNIRYSRGVNNIFVEQPNDNTVFKNNVFSLGLGARFK
jgi:Outer membrane protein beta-barrel domain